MRTKTIWIRFWNRLGLRNPLQRGAPGHRVTHTSRVASRIEIVEPRYLLSSVTTSFSGQLPQLASGNANLGVAGNSGNQALLFETNPPGQSAQLWRSDGTAGGTIGLATVQLEPVASGTNLGTSPPLVTLNGVQYFLGFQAAGAPQLWRTDGTSSGTSVVTNLPQLSSGLTPIDLTSVNGTLYFFTQDATHGWQLWKSNGTAAGTTVVTSMDFGGQYANRGMIGSGITPDPASPNAADFFFFAAPGPTAATSTFGYQLALSDGTAAGTTLLTNITSNTGSYGSGFTDVGPAVVENGRLFFFGGTGHGVDLWTSSGSAQGTLQLTNIGFSSVLNPDQSIQPQAFGNGVLFEASDGVHGYQLWSSDGTAGGTAMLTDLNSGGGGIDPNSLVVSGGTAWFTANDGTHGNQIWQSNGTAGGTMMLTDINPGPSAGLTFASGSAALSPNLIDVNESLYFLANDGVHGSQLWRTEPVAGGAAMLSNVSGGFIVDASHPIQVQGAMGNVLFTATSPANGSQLWTSDGTVAGTEMVTNVTPGLGGLLPSAFVAGGTGAVFFDGNSASNAGTSAWKATLTPSIDYNAAVATSPTGHLTLQVYGGFLQLVDTDNNLLLGNQPLAATSDPTILGESGRALALTVNLSGATTPPQTTIVFVGGSTSDQNTLQISGGTYDSTGYDFADSTSGDVHLLAGGATTTVQFSNLSPLNAAPSPLTLNVSTPYAVLNLPSGANAALASGGSTATLSWSNGGFTRTSFQVPAQSLTVNLGEGATLTLGPLSGGLPSVVVNDAGDNDVVNIVPAALSPITVNGAPGAGNETVVVDLTTVTVSQPPFNLLGTSGQWTFSNAAAVAYSNMHAMIPIERMYRAYNPNAGLHVYTTSYGEFSFIVGHGLTDETTGWPGFSVAANQLSNDAPVYRLYNPHTGEHYYTVQSGEEQALVRSGWTFEKYEGYLYPTQVPGSTLIYRLYNQVNGGHLYSASVAEVNAILAKFPGIWVTTTSLGYGFAVPGGDSLAPVASPSVSQPESSALDLATTGLLPPSVSGSGGSALTSLLAPALAIAPASSGAADISVSQPTPATLPPFGAPRDNNQSTGSVALDNYWSSMSLGLQSGESLFDR